MGSDWHDEQPPRRRRPLVDAHDVGGLILFAILAAPFVFAILKWLLGK
jgi:hypothetical protein